MLRQNASNNEVYNEALHIINDFNGFDEDWQCYPERLPAVIATVVYQLLQKKEDR